LTYNTIVLSCLVAGITLLAIYSISEQRRERIKLGKAILRELDSEDWELANYGIRLRDTEFANALPTEMFSNDIQAPFLYNMNAQTWLFANYKTMHRRTSVLGCRIAFVAKVPEGSISGIRIEEYYKPWADRGPWDRRFGNFTKRNIGERHWWLCSTSGCAVKQKITQQMIEAEVPDDIECVQIMDGYFVASLGYSPSKVSSFCKATESSLGYLSRINHIFTL
tara:strand:- start:757 stop:1425 length:669 start_codon:yes stop_codon:yes gene_type:complete